MLTNTLYKKAKTGGHLWRHLSLCAAAGIILFLLVSCKTTEVVEPDPIRFYPPPPTQEELEYKATHFNDGTKIVTKETAFDDSDSLLMTFAGDIMAHTPNWSKGRFDEIYAAIKPYLIESDFVFANLETPVADSIEYATYPAFNVHHEYAEAAISAGFNVFSLTNNHTNDRGLKGINETREWFKKKVSETAGSDRPVYACGLKEKSNDPLTYQILEKNGWTILYVAITEILNNPSNSPYIDYVEPYKKQREQFISTLKKMKEEHPADLFILSIHCAEPEYILTVQKTQKEFYFQLLDAGVDVVWVNHPHVPKYWELVPDTENTARKMIFYSMGNTISAQRTKPNWSKPSDGHEYTGEGNMIQVRFTKDEDGVKVSWINPMTLTTYIESDRMYVIKLLDDDFIQSLYSEGVKNWPKYLTERKKLMEQITGTVTWQ